MEELGAGRKRMIDHLPAFLERLAGVGCRADGRGDPARVGAVERRAPRHLLLEARRREPRVGVHQVGVGDEVERQHHVRGIGVEVPEHRRHRVEMLAIVVVDATEVVVEHDHVVLAKPGVALVEHPEAVAMDGGHVVRELVGQPGVVLVDVAQVRTVDAVEVAVRHVDPGAGERVEDARPVHGEAVRGAVPEHGVHVEADARVVHDRRRDRMDRFDAGDGGAAGPEMDVFSRGSHRCSLVGDGWSSTTRSSMEETGCVRESGRPTQRCSSSQP